MRQRAATGCEAFYRDDSPPGPLRLGGHPEASLAVYFPVGFVRTGSRSLAQEDELQRIDPPAESLEIDRAVGKDPPLGETSPTPFAHLTVIDLTVLPSAGFERQAVLRKKGLELLCGDAVGTASALKARRRLDQRSDGRDSNFQQLSAVFPEKNRVDVSDDVTVVMVAEVEIFLVELPAGAEIRHLVCESS